MPVPLPDCVAVYAANAAHRWPAGSPMAWQDVSVALNPVGGNLTITLQGDKTPISFLSLRWNQKLPENARFLGDAWERSYGDLMWRPCQPSRLMPWYFAMATPEATTAWGVEVRPGTMAAWSADPEGVTLWLDARCGGKGVTLNGRALPAATVVTREYPGPGHFAAMRRFCRELCHAPLLPAAPVYGGNNWYYAYGDSDESRILADCDYVAGLAAGLENRPFMVIDDGWQVRHRAPGNSGPWDGGNARFPDMAGLPAKMRAKGVRPGIWFRPLWNLDPKIGEAMLLLAKDGAPERFLDPSVPETLEQVKSDVRRIVDWGFELIKHDFSTFDIFGRWGPAMNPWPAEGDWVFADRSRTAAEIVTGLYRAIREAAGDALIIGCNTIGHLGAGLMHLSRTGDDTSGVRWDRTRTMGVNTLAFRLCQHETFFAVDADCLGVAGPIPWELNREWAELLAKSGTPFFASIKPGILNPREWEETRRLFAIASRPQAAAEPLDWMDTAVPARWRFADGETRYAWFEKTGTVPDFTGREQF